MVLQRGESVLDICGLFRGASVAGNRNATGVRLPRTTAQKPLLQAALRKQKHRRLDPKLLEVNGSLLISFSVFGGNPQGKYSFLKLVLQLVGPGGGIFHAYTTVRKMLPKRSYYKPQTILGKEGKKPQRSLDYKPDLLCLIRGILFQWTVNVIVLTDVDITLTLSQCGKLLLGCCSMGVKHSTLKGSTVI